MSDQGEQIGRVRSRLAGAVVRFLRHRIANQVPRFTAAELRDWSTDEAHSAPGSPDRILRDLRRRGVIDYQVLDRARSLYLVTRAS